MLQLWSWAALAILTTTPDPAEELVPDDVMAIADRNGGDWQGMGGPTPPCTDGTWGHITDPGTAWHVRVDGDDDNDGSPTSPFETIREALDAIDDLGEKNGTHTIALGPGTFEVDELEIDDKHLNGTTIEGCGVLDTFLVAEDLDDDDPIIDIEKGEFGLAGMTLIGGGGVVIGKKATGVLTDVFVEDAVGTGITVEKKATAILVDTTVVTPFADEGCGWGIHANKATLLMSGGGVIGAHEAGIFVKKSEYVLDGVLIEDTAQRADGTFGRGLHAEKSEGEITNATFAGNCDASVFLHKPKKTLVSNIVIDITGAGLTDTGDGIVVMGRTNDDRTRIRWNAVEACDRAAMVVEDTEVKLKGNDLHANGTMPWLGADLIGQGDFVVDGNQAIEVMDLGDKNGPSALPINRDKLTCDD